MGSGIENKYSFATDNLDLFISSLPYQCLAEGTSERKCYRLFMLLYSLVIKILQMEKSNY